VREHKIDCAFARRPMHLYATGHEDSAREKLEKELDACVRAGLRAQLVDSIALPCRTDAALVLENQAQFHPLEYVREIAQRIANDRCRFFENSEVIEIDEENRTLVTAGGRVLGVTAVAETLPRAIAQAYEGIKLIRFEGLQYRTDIGRKAFGEGRRA